jgi:lipid A ethanolaminephosphotransferase
VKTSKLIIIASVILVLCFNISFFSNVTSVYAATPGNIPFLVSIVIMLGSFIALLLSLVISRYTAKPILIAVFLLSSIAAYFMDSYNVIIDITMIQNAMMTDTAEFMDLVNIKLILYFLVLGILPAIVIYKVIISIVPLKTSIFSRLNLILVLLFLLASQLLLFSKTYASFFREHKELRYYTNPVTYIYSAGKYVNSMLATSNIEVEPVGQDARTPHTDAHRELTILVIGETARADRLSLNGYARETNPLLANENVISFTNMHSCGTSTAVSVPCMFSMYSKDEYDDEKGKSTENLLDVLSHAGTHVLWRDNNSDSKGVALRVQYEDYKSPEVNPDCDIECRDDGMLAGLQEYIDAQNEGDILIVLHQMGNHGPAYYKRYPKSFEKFTPVCKTNHLDLCSETEISNAYDNAILYTDFFLSKVIDLLKQNMNRFETAMLYMSDHGESLGESGVYLHGLPYFMAPDSQTHVASIFWFGDNYDEINIDAIRQKADMEFSHDNLFHTVLGLMEVETSIYNRDLDIIYFDRQQEPTKIFTQGFHLHTNDISR